jgi:hypothetical protein
MKFAISAVIGAKRAKLLRKRASSSPQPKRIRFQPWLRSGRDAERPPGFAGLEARPQRVTVLPPDVERLKAFIAERAIAA